jgi:aspartate oxidase
LVELTNSLGSEPDLMQNRALVAWLIATAALTREESRGAHFRTDVPMELPEWQTHIVQRRGTPVRTAP